MKKLLVDSDIIIELTKANTYVISRLNLLEQTHILCISAVSRYEVLIGSRNKQELQWLLQLLGNFETIWLNENISKKAEKLIVAYNLSHNLQLADALIASTAIYYNADLISRNQKDFRYITGLNLLPS